MPVRQARADLEQGLVVALGELVEPEGVVADVVLVGEPLGLYKFLDKEVA